MKIQEFLIERFYAMYEFSTPYMLSSSDAESFTVQDLLALEAGAQDGFLQFKLSYTESTGAPELRRGIAALYESMHEDDVLIFAGAEEGIFIFMNLLGIGDHFISMFPAYQSSFQIAKDSGVQVDYWYLREEQDWQPNMSELRAMIRPTTRALLINSPHNPTGYNLSRAELDEIVSICREHDLILFSDEVYRLGEYNTADRLPAAVDLYDRAVSLGVFSKPLGLPGLRIGWIATKDRKLLQFMQKFKDYTTICNSGPSEFLATLAIRHSDVLLARNRAIIEHNLDLLRKFMHRYADLFEWVEPKAGNIGFVRTKFTDDAQQFCLDLIEAKGVLLLPSTTYSYDNEHFRIGFGRKNFPEALQLLEEYVKSLLVQ